MKASGVELIAAERQRQIDVEGWTPEHDGSELAAAAVGYITRTQTILGGHPAPPGPPLVWPWADAWWKPSSDPVRNLVKAGALIAAEIDRLQAQR